MADFGTNPGGLRMYLHVPRPSPRRAPLVVVLHGCGQTAAGFEVGARWAELADAHGFVVLYPEQQSRNNQHLCFNWFVPDDTRRGQGEVESIRQMIARAVATTSVDPRRVYVCGLSAGGAMAGAMLATYPDLFAGGAIVAGLPYGTASNTSEALESMYAGRTKDAAAWGDLVRSASAHPGPWPSVFVWHGSSDATVRASNAGELVKQWCNVHGLDLDAPVPTHLGPIARRAWGGEGDGCARVVEYSLPGFMHGMPVDAMTSPAPFFLPSNVSAVRQIAGDWGLLAPARRRGLFARLGLKAV